MPSLRDEPVERQRLRDLLHNGIRSRLVLISAPAGFDKTRLLTE